MNTAEKIAALYLRLNGFFLMPQFTTFGAGAKEREDGGRSHDHTDILAFRPANSYEDNQHIAKKKNLAVVEFPLDGDFFTLLSEVVSGDARKCNIGIVCEVRANADGEFANENRANYCSRLFGGLEPVRVLMDEKAPAEITADEEGIRVGIQRALAWIRWRVWWIDNECKKAKSYSWTWSDEFLADLILLERFALVPTKVVEFENLFPNS